MSGRSPPFVILYRTLLTLLIAIELIAMQEHQTKVVYYIVSVLLFLLFFWCLCMAINVSVQQYNGGLLPDIILLTRSYFHRGTPLNAMKRFCICSLCSHLINVLTPPPPLTGASSEGLGAF